LDEDFDYRSELAEIDEYCSYLEQTLEEELINSWTLIVRTKDYALFQNMLKETRTINADYINKIFKEK